MAKGIQIARVTSANSYDPLNQDLGSQLSNNIIDPLLLWYLWVGSVKVEPQWAKYPNLSVRSFVTSEKPILGFYFVAKMVHIYVTFLLVPITL
jgi:hypothetical protein